MAGIVLDGVTKAYSQDVVAVKDLCLEVGDGELVVLVGPSGCGKSTTLRLIAGLEQATRGQIWIGDRRVEDLLPGDRDVAMVFQSAATFPHMSVAANIGFGLKLRRRPRAEIRRRVLEVATALGLEELLQRKPAELSGGQRQRVAIGRAMLREPQAFLMDEPLSSLDARLRAQMRAELARLQRRLATTTLYVTHDQAEAMTLGDRVAVLNAGALEQLDTPQNLYTHPASVFVAAFIGSPVMNFVEAAFEDQTLFFADMRLSPPSGVDLSAYRGGRVILGIRPSDLTEPEEHQWELPVLEATLETTENLGSQVNVIFSVQAPPAIDEDLRLISGTASQGRPLATATNFFTATLASRTTVRPGDRVRLSLDPARLYFFDAKTGLALPSTARQDLPPPSCPPAHRRSKS